MLSRLVPQSFRRPTVLSCQRRSFATPNERAKNKPAPSDLYEPRIESKKIYPEYSKLNLRLRGYDYVILEKYQSFVHKMAKNFGFQVADSFATAARTQRAVIYKPRTSVVESECELSVYERTVQRPFVEVLFSQ
uniref:Ribosomal protein S10 domain-containing protein n=1 Tax=Plectus sambesii TaxID=2011161 RepID=A0A914VV39_9BILA